MSDFRIFVPIVLDVEDGYQADPRDSGNFNSLHQNVGTNCGISAKTFEGWIGRPPTVADMKAITPAIAMQIYKVWYWDKLKGDQIADQSVANIIVDHAVNAGPGRAAKLLQETLNKRFAKNLIVDGAVGNATIQATNSVNGQQLFNYIKEAREDYYRSLGGAFLDGWIERLTNFVYEKKK
ncbi:MAG TPA: glycosyl hydrolase 108 family protein [Flavobacterium sp.]|nr:glycosyl hydrolase 108 family protein [Flavobacterium sp.]